MHPLSDETKKTLILVEVTGVLAIALMITRLFMRKIRGQKYNWSDYLTMIAIFCILGRTVLTTVVLIWQNNNISKAVRQKHIFTNEEIYRREVGSKLTLVNRVVYNTYVWIQKAVVLLLYHRMLAGLRWPERFMKLYWVILFLTLVAVQVSCFVECRPFRHYYQVIPDPGTCTKAALQIYVLVSMNAFTDVLLIVLPIPWLLRIKRPLTQRLQLIGLFSIGIGLIIITICRLPVYGSGITQTHRNTLGSIEGFFAAFVANIPTLFTLRRRTTGVARLASSSPSNGRLCVEKKDSKFSKEGCRAISSSDDGILVTRDVEMLISKAKTQDENMLTKHMRPNKGVERNIV